MNKKQPTNPPAGCKLTCTSKCTLGNKWIYRTKNIVTC